MIKSLFYFENGSVGACDKRGKQILKYQKGNLFLEDIDRLRQNGAINEQTDIHIHGWHGGVYRISKDGDVLPGG